MKCKFTACVSVCACDGHCQLLYRSFLATNEEMSQYKQVPFYKCCLSFHGFVEEEQQRMEAIAASSGIPLEQNHFMSLA